MLMELLFKEHFLKMVRNYFLLVISIIFRLLCSYIWYGGHLCINMCCMFLIFFKKGMNLQYASVLITYLLPRLTKQNLNKNFLNIWHHHKYITPYTFSIIIDFWSIKIEILKIIKKCSGMLILMYYENIFHTLIEWLDRCTTKLHK